MVEKNYAGCRDAWHYEEIRETLQQTTRSISSWKRAKSTPYLVRTALKNRRL